MYNFGKVIDINDPLNSGRVKVRVNVIYEELSESDIPWAIVLRSNDSSINSNIGLSNHNLVVGQQVVVDFLDENQQVPVVMGSVPKTSDLSLNLSLTKRTFKTSSGHLITIDDTEGSEAISIIDKNQNKVVMQDKQITVTSPTVKIICNDGQITGNLKVDKNLSVGGSETISGSSTITGDITTSGGVTATGIVTATNCMAGSVSLLTHVHPGVIPGPSSTGTPI